MGKTDYRGQPRMTPIVFIILSSMVACSIENYKKPFLRKGAKNSTYLETYNQRPNIDQRGFYSPYDTNQAFTHNVLTPNFRDFYLTKNKI